MNSTVRLVLWPVAITLGVTLLRLCAELYDWGPLLANEDGGGPGALIGIVWLMFVFGGWFGHRLVQRGELPPQPGRTALAFAALAVATPAIGVAMMQLMAFPWVVAVNGIFYIIAATLASRLWPALAQVLLVYAIGARIPVGLITMVALQRGWGTHYEKIGSGDGIDLQPNEAVVWLIAAQIFVWIPWTLVFGGLTGAVVAWWKTRGTVAVAR